MMVYFPVEMVTMPRICHDQVFLLSPHGGVLCGRELGRKTSRELCAKKRGGLPKSLQKNSHTPNRHFGVKK
jgi:hypothetical protein